MVLNASVSYAEDFQVVNVKIFGGTNILISTNGTDVQYSGELSADKQKLNITINNALIGDRVREQNTANGRIESCYIQKRAKNVVVTILLRSKSGYTASLLPYSRAISIDVFDWEKLSPSEDNYRSGLLALENNVYATAKEYFQKAVSLQHPDATAHLSFLTIKQGDMSKGKYLASLALKRNSTLADVYGALAQTSRSEQDETKAREFEQEFVKRAGRPPYFDEGTINIDIKAIQEFEPSSLVLSDTTTARAIEDSAIAATQDSSTKDNDLFSQLQQLQGSSQTKPQVSSDSTISQQAQQGNSLPSWLSNTVIALGAGLILIGVFLLRSYNQWRRDKMLALALYQQNLMQQQAVANNGFASHLDSAMNTTTGSHNQSGAIDESMTTPERIAVQSYIQQSASGEDTYTTQSRTSNQSPIQDKEALFDFDENYYKEHEERKRLANGLSKNVTGERQSIPSDLLYQTPSGSATSQGNIRHISVEDTTPEALNSDNLPASQEDTFHLLSSLKRRTQSPASSASSTRTVDSTPIQQPINIPKQPLPVATSEELSLDSPEIQDILRQIT